MSRVGGFKQAPTWTFLRVVLVALVASLLFMLFVAWNSFGFGPLLHVLFLISIAVTLSLLLSWYNFSHSLALVPGDLGIVLFCSRVLMDMFEIPKFSFICLKLLHGGDNAVQVHRF